MASASRLRLAFAAGAITDGAALVPMLCPFMAKVLWGFSDVSGAYLFAMGYAASLMLGWTILLVWAYKRPIERRFVALLTLVVIAGLVLTEIVVVAMGTIGVVRMIPTWTLQMALVYLFASGFTRASRHVRRPHTGSAGDAVDRGV